MTTEPPDPLLAPLPSDSHPLLKAARRLTVVVLQPQAQAVDRSGRPPVEALRLLAEAGILGAAVPVEYGGTGVPGAVLRSLQERLASACGTTAFILFQHFGVCNQLARCDNDALKAALLPRLATGEAFGTLAFSHLRRPGPPAVTVREEGDALVFDGTAPWATGWGVATELLLAGTLPDGRSAWAMVPAAESPALQPSAPLPLCAAGASATVSLRLEGLRVDRERWVRTVTREQLTAEGYVGQVSHSMLSLGVARAAIHLVHASGTFRRDPVLVETAVKLHAEAEAAREAVETCAKAVKEPDFPERVVRARCRCIDLGVRAAHAAVLAGGGRANELDHPAQRLYREAMLFSVTALIPELRECALRQITGSGEGA